MCLKFATLALLCLNGLAAQNLQYKEKRQLNQIPEIAGFEQKKQNLLVPAAAGFVPQPAPAAPHTAANKYFQYDHRPGYDHYEHGHKRGQQHHFVERHERSHPHQGEFKAKVRWGDKHGGYGEHYWDFNHAGHDNDGEGDSSHHHEAYEEYDEPSESNQLPFVAAVDSSSAANQRADSVLPGIPSLYQTTNENQQRGKRNPDDDVEFVDESARSRIMDESSPKHGGNYRKAKEEYRTKRHPVVPESFDVNPVDLFYDASSGYIVDEKTGRQFKLSPVN